jgi:hypothetical protein
VRLPANEHYIFQGDGASAVMTPSKARPQLAKIASAPLPEMITNAMMILAITARYCGLRSA